MAGYGQVVSLQWSEVGRSIIVGFDGEQLALEYSGLSIVAPPLHPPRMPPEDTGGGVFPVTRWSVVARAQSDDSETRAQALEEFCRAYWLPLYAYARRRGNSKHDTEDLVQGFFFYLLEKPDRFEGIDPERGRLRSWLLTTFRNYMTTEWRRNAAQKRGGTTEFVPLDLSQAEDLCSGINEVDSPEQVFDRQWAQVVIHRARELLEQAHIRARKRDEYVALQPFLDADSEANAMEVASRMGKTAGAVRVAIARLRGDYRAAIRAEIAATMGELDDVDSEMTHLVSCL